MRNPSRELAGRHEPGQGQLAAAAADGHLHGFEGLACANTGSLIQACCAFDRERLCHPGIAQVEMPASDLDVEPIGDLQLQISDFAGGEAHH
jgi:hypothetical protein